MSKVLILLCSFIISGVLGAALVFSLPGHYESDEISIQTQQKSWQISWDFPDQSLLVLITDSLTNTLALQSVSFFCVLFFPFFLSIIVLKWSGLSGFLEKVLVIGTSVPSLFLIPLFIYFFSLKWNLFPLRYEPTFTGWVLPLLALTIRPLCLSTQILLSEWKKAEKQPYFLVARSKGLSKVQAYYRHGLKNALLPYSSQMGNFFVQSLMGSFLVESLFSFPGIGRLFVQSLQSRDLPVVLALTILFSGIMICVHTFVEVIQNYLEPREARL